MSAFCRRFASRLLQPVVSPLLLGYLFVLIVWLALDTSAQTAQKRYFYASPNGSDSNAGTSIPVSGTSYYVSPDGGGNCSSSSPCSLDAALSKAGPGDEVMLLNGEYRQRIATSKGGTANAPVTIRAENRHQAIVRVPLPAPRRSAALRIRHSNVTVRGLVFDGGKQTHFGVGISGRRSELSNVIIEDNQIKNLSGVGFSIQTARNIIVRHNLIDGTGYFASNQDHCCGSAFYVASPGSSTPRPVTNLEVYGNTIRDATNNAIDLKGSDQVDNIDIHHNIIEKHVWPWDHGHPYPSQPGHGWNDGLFLLQGSNVKFHDNIIRDSEAGAKIFGGHKSAKVTNNVVMNSKSNILVKGNNLAVSDNTFCSLQSYKGVSNANGNRINASQSACDAEVKRILSEMTQLPGTR